MHDILFQKTKNEVQMDKKMHKVEIETFTEIEKSICKIVEGFSVGKTEFTAFAFHN